VNIRDLLVRHISTAHSTVSPQLRVIRVPVSSLQKRHNHVLSTSCPTLRRKRESRISPFETQIDSANNRQQAEARSTPKPNLGANSACDNVVSPLGDDGFQVDHTLPLDFDFEQFMEFPYLEGEPLLEDLSWPESSLTSTTSMKPVEQPVDPSCADSLKAMDTQTRSAMTLTQHLPAWTPNDTDWAAFVAQMDGLAVPGFACPVRTSMSRYLAAYFRSFHEHLPFLHASTTGFGRREPYLLLAIAMIGAQYCLETEVVAVLFAATKVCVMQEIDKYRMHMPQQSLSTSSTELAQSDPVDARTIPLQICQTLLLLMVAATWGHVRRHAMEELDLQHTLANCLRNYGLLNLHSKPVGIAWPEWVQIEGTRRTVLIAFCFFNFHTILYNVPPSVLASEIHMKLPCDERVWRCTTATAWHDLTKNIDDPQPEFSGAFAYLLDPCLTAPTPMPCSSLGLYILISALIQRIYLLHQLENFGDTGAALLSPLRDRSLPQALDRWQQLWELDPHKSTGPGVVGGPLPFNSTAQFRMAHIRVSMNIGSCFTSTSHSPEEIAIAMLNSPRVLRNSCSTTAALHAAHTLSTPVKLGVKIVARTQALTWSLQHSLSYLEAAFFLSKWLEVITAGPEGITQQLDEYEQQVLSYVASLLDEARTDAPEDSNAKISVRLVIVWASLLGRDAIWPIVKLVGEVLTIYAQMLADRSRNDMLTVTA
jgi:hypothetical protein